MFRTIIMLAMASLLLGCAGSKTSVVDKQFPRFHPQETLKLTVDDQPPLPLRDRLAWPVVDAPTEVKSEEQLYSFVARNMSIRKAVQLFAKAYDLNVLIDDEVQGKVNVDFKDLSFGLAMNVILGSQGYSWEQERNLIRVKARDTRIFTINYIRLSRSGTGKTEAQVSSGSSGGEGGDSGESDSKAGSISIEQENKIKFWSELEKQLEKLISDQGRLVVNRLAGTVQVSDLYPRVEEMARYIEEVNQAIHRQVDIEVKILEVTLNEDFSLGVDWTRVVDRGNGAVDVDWSIQTGITSPAGTGTALPNVFNLTAEDVSGTGRRSLTAMVSALSEQGEVQIVSQPHIRTLNNQSAMIKVGTDRTFFRRETSTDSTTGVSSTTTTDIPQVVTEGIVLSITPQISRDGWVMMDVSPVVTRVSSVSEVKGTTGNVESSAPNLDIRQTSSLIRAFNGETVVIGGLIQTTEANTDRGIPGVKDVPGAGHLFKSQYEAVIKKELIIFLTPKLVDSTPDVPMLGMAGGSS